MSLSLLRMASSLGQAGFAEWKGGFEGEEIRRK